MGRTGGGDVCVRGVVGCGLVSDHGMRTELRQEHKQNRISTLDNLSGVCTAGPKEGVRARARFLSKPCPSIVGTPFSAVHVRMAPPNFTEHVDRREGD